MNIQSVSNSTDTQSSKESGILPKFVKDKVNRYPTTVSTGLKNGRPLILGKLPSRDLLMLQSNDYLSISKNPKIIQAQINCLRDRKRDAVMSAVFLHDDVLNPLLTGFLMYFIRLFSVQRYCRMKLLGLQLR